MASLPPQRPQRRASQRQQSDSVAASTSGRQSSQSPSAKSIDSQTLLLNDPKASPGSEHAKDSPGASTSSTQANESKPESRKCWICFQDETDDGPHASPWRTPCPCALTAHESCLLDWVADMEAPDTTRSTSAPKEIKCPQCKAEIRLARPHSLIVAATSRAEQLTAKLLVPGVCAGLMYGLRIVMEHHGLFTIQMIFGYEDARAITARSPYITHFEAMLLQLFPTISRPLIRRWRGSRVEFGLPLIPAALIASRTTFGDAILPVLPILFFATHRQTSAELGTGLWPPSAALTLVVLPYVRGLYNEYLERVWGERERRWSKEIRPRLGEEGDNDDGQGNDADHDHDQENMVEVEVDIEVDTSDDESEAGEQDEPPARVEGDDNARPADGVPEAPAADEPPAIPDDRPRDREREQELRREAEARVHNLAEQIADAADQEDQRQDHQHHHHHHRGQIDLIASATRIAETSLGALAFPAVSAAMGQILYRVLPAGWVTPQYQGRQIVPTGLLQTRWGRSIIGGCLFVVLKDAVRIYCRWKMAQTFQKRRVQDYDKVLAKFVAPR